MQMVCCVEMVRVLLLCEDGVLCAADVYGAKGVQKTLVAVCVFN